jgi:hypothetical protein
MPVGTTLFHARRHVWFILFTLTLAAAQTSPSRQGPAAPGSHYSGMYSFLRDGEFVQITVEDQGRITGFVSRYGDSESDRGVFLDHFFKSGKLDGNQLTFTTDTVHGVSFEFRGTVERGDGKKPGEEAYYMLKGTLIETATDEAKKTSSHSRDVALKSFPQDMSPPQAQQK